LKEKIVSDENILHNKQGWLPATWLGDVSNGGRNHPQGNA